MLILFSIDTTDPSCAFFLTTDVHLSASSYSSADNLHVNNAIDHFNDQVFPSDVITAGVSSTPVAQRTQSKKLEYHRLNSLLGDSSMADRACLLSVSAPAS